MVFSFLSNLIFILPLVVHQCVNRKNRNFIIDIDLVVSTIFECLFNLICVLSIWSVVLEPDIKHEIEEFLLLFLEGRVVVPLCIIVTEGEENWCIREILGKKLLDLLMCILKNLIPWLFFRGAFMFQ